MHIHTVNVLVIYTGGSQLSLARVQMESSRQDLLEKSLWEDTEPNTEMEAAHITSGTASIFFNSADDRECYETKTIRMDSFKNNDTGWVDNMLSYGQGAGPPFSPVP